MSADRNIRARTAGDQSGYLQFEPGPDNSQYATIQNGQLVLSFNEDTEGTSDDDFPRGDQVPEGLNQDSMTKFDGVFTILNTAPAGSEAAEKGIKVYLEENYDRIGFYWTDAKGKPSGPATKDNPATISPPGASGNSKALVGVKINLDDYESIGEIFKGEDDFTIVAEAND